jgi:hypothetical protein
MMTGYEQVRSVVAEIAGDHAAAREVRLVLPETGVCGAPSFESSSALDGATSCCGGPAPALVDACCAQDADAKALGHEGCGCGSHDVGVAHAATAGETKPGGLRLVPLATRQGSGDRGSCCS